MALIDISVNYSNGGSIRIALDDHLNLRYNREFDSKDREVQARRATEAGKVQNELKKIFGLKEIKRTLPGGDRIFAMWDIDNFVKSELKNEKPTVSEVAYIAKKITAKFGYDFDYKGKIELTERLK